ncbi:MAG: hypothetical protein JWN96_1338 [Mycobacterium sp.]|nr:hypothetical protein [Mycobacterium sp.]
MDGRLESSNDERALLLTPTGRDAPLIASFLTRAGVSSLTCSSIDHLCQEIEVGAGTVLIADEVLNSRATECLLQAVAAQPQWSELPIIVLTATGQTSRGSTQLAESLERLGNVTHLERPVRPLTLASTVRTALRARRRQYEIRDLLAAKEVAILDYQSGVRQRDEFLAMLGHELRNPLATVNGCLHVLDQLGWAPESIGEQRPVMQRQVRHLSRLVDDLLDVARITNGAIALQRSPVNFAELVQQCVESMGERFQSLGVTLTLKSTGDSIWVDGDAVRLEQIVTNLLTNASKFTPAGGAVNVSVSALDKQAVLSVRDSGVGIPREMQDRVFDLFAQAHVSIDRTLGGLGLGLTIVRRLAELHGGTVSVRSEGTGLGTEFEIHFPLLAPAKPAEKTKSSGATVGRRVLLVEDNADARKVMEKLIRLWGHEVEVATDGPEAVTKAASLRPDVVVLDIGLPGFDGYEVARRLRANGNRDTCLIALTGYGQNDDRLRAIDAGFNAHVVKPVDFMQLSRLITECST